MWAVRTYSRNGVDDMAVHLVTNSELWVKVGYITMPYALQQTLMTGHGYRYWLLSAIVSTVHRCRKHDWPISVIVSIVRRFQTRPGISVVDHRLESGVVAVWLTLKTAAR